MSTLEQILEITSRLDHLESVADWMSRETCQIDPTLAQTSTLIMVLAEDLRERICVLAKDIEDSKDLSMN